MRYRLNCAKPQSYVCHCRECQRQSASAFAISVPVRFAWLDVSGDLRSYQRATDSGSTTDCWFCPGCGVRIYHQSARSPEIVTLKGGTLDDAARLSPLAHLWVSRKATWVTLPENVPAYDTQPDDLRMWRDGLIENAEQAG